MASESFKLLLRHATNRLQHPREVCGMASQLSVDNIIVKNNQNIPGVKETFPMPKDFNLPENSYMEDYYRRLKDNIEEMMENVETMFGEADPDQQQGDGEGSGQGEGNGEGEEKEDGKGGSGGYKELDPSLLDRFNVYDFNPTPGEWIDWANDAGEIHEAVVGFIAKNLDFLDPPNAKDAKADQVYPSRRSWERVSVNLKKYPELLTNKDRILQNQLHGIVGLGASSAFINFLKEYGSGISAGLILTKWDEKMEMKVSQIDVQQQIHMVNQICVHLDQKYEEYEKAGAVVSKKIVTNLEHFLNTISTEAMASFFGRVKTDYQEKQKKWPTWVVVKNKHLGDKFKEVMNGKS